MAMGKGIQIFHSGGYHARQAQKLLSQFARHHSLHHRLVVRAWHHNTRYTAEKEMGETPKYGQFDSNYKEIVHCSHRYGKACIQGKVIDSITRVPD
mgnify:CR=1 FL=1